MWGRGWTYGGVAKIRFKGRFCKRMNFRKLTTVNVRTLYRAAGNWKDVLDNPFYDKYKRKLERVQGQVFSIIIFHTIVLALLYVTVTPQ